MKKITQLLAVSLLLFSCSKSHDGMQKATLKDLTGLDGCGILIELENGTKLEPTNLSVYSNDVSIEDGKKVWIKYHEVEMASICMVGPMIVIDELEER